MTTILTDPRTLDAPALRQWIAARKGWRLEFVREDRDYDPFGPVWWFNIYQDERICGRFYISGPIQPSDDYAWKRLIQEMNLPDWPEDVAAALELVGKIAFVLQGRNGEWQAKCGLGDQFGPAETNPARAICLAWLAWRKSQQSTE